MFEFIRTLQEKPRSSRKRIAAATSVGITAFIAMIWLTTFVGPTDSTAGLYSKDSETENSRAASPLVALKENISRTFTSVQNRFESAPGKTQNTSTEGQSSSRQSAQRNGMSTSSSSTTTTVEITGTSSTKEQSR